MATCFDYIESSSGLLENRSNVSQFIVHFWIPEFTIKVDTLDLFFRRPDDDSTESKHVAIRIFCGINCCFTEIYSLYELNKLTGMTDVKTILVCLFSD
jgi:hypothetical protein